MLDISQQLALLEPIDGRDLPERDPLYTRQVREAMDLYRQGWEKASAGCWDLAVASLRKAISWYPSFSRAVLLLHVCLEQQAQEGAGRPSVFALPDIQVALLPLPEDPLEVSPEQSAKRNRRRKRYSSPRRIRLRFACWAYGALLVLLFALVYSSSQLDLENRHLSLLLQQSQWLGTGEDTLAPPEDDKADDLAEEIMRQKAQTLAEELAQYCRDAQYLDGVEVFQELDLSYLTPDERKEAEALYELCLAEFTESHYASLYSLREVHRWEELIVQLRPIVDYHPHYEKISTVLYYLGEAYEELGEREQAVYFYQIAANEHGNTTYGGYAKLRLTLLGI